MYGFWVNDCGVDSVKNGGNKKDDIIESINLDKYNIGRTTSSKFFEDKIFYENEKYFMILEGIILNKSELCDQYGLDWEDTLSHMIDADEERYFDSFRGNFCGAHYNKLTKTWVIYTNPYENRPVYYYVGADAFVVSTELEYIAKVLRQSGIDYTIDCDAVYEMLSFGFMIQDRTYIKEVKKIPYGCYIRKEESVTVKRYYEFQYGDQVTSDNVEDIVDNIDKLFREAVRLQFEKDKEYGYRHIATLSGGLDSRMVVWVASEMGYDDMLNINFCQSDYLDETIAKSVSQHLGTELLVKSLNDGKFMMDYDFSIRSNNGMSLYSGMSHGNSILKYINFDDFGIVHTGDLGDAIVGVYDKGKTPNDPYPGAYSTKMAARINRDWDISTIGGVEKFKMLFRGFGGVVQSMAGQNFYAESMSPFLYRDFFDYCIRQIPYSLRADHYIYKKWVMAKYPQAAGIPLERYGGGVMGEGKARQTLRKMKKMGILGLIDWSFWKVGIKKELDRRLLKESMNPFDVYYESFASIKSNMDTYFESTSCYLKESKVITSTLYKDMELLYKEGTAIEKTQVITALGGINILFG